MLVDRERDGFRVCLGDVRVLCHRNRICMGVYALMTPWELVLGSVMALGLTIYLVLRDVASGKILREA